MYRNIEIEQTSNAWTMILILSGRRTKLKNRIQKKYIGFSTIAVISAIKYKINQNKIKNVLIYEQKS